ncbi:hypothetical protein BDU57DRAFT_558004 [Ampelomyces quisqualis]|uniref:Zinc-ribbon 15 domain-containing protein n=1 Tax=Ampelomyces quisqualis TaxID=50730 RepID=A0A6A5QHQ8_AMPQU|nr:hypothetical protein BDU57DRAFT_558004 [Ampelomyces quisqualis]
MFFFFTCGTHVFNSPLRGAEHITAQCQNCGNFSVFLPPFVRTTNLAPKNIQVTKRWEWFTFCFVPIIPFSLRPHTEVGCHICRFGQDVKYRPDVMQQIHGGGGAGAQLQGGEAVMMQGGQQGGQGGYGAPPQGVPQYK